MAAVGDCYVSVPREAVRQLVISSKRSVISYLQRVALVSFWRTTYRLLRTARIPLLVKALRYAGRPHVEVGARRYVKGLESRS